MKRLVRVEEVEQRVSKNNKPYWVALTVDGDEVFCYEEIKPNDLICIETRHTFFGKVAS